MVRSQVILLVFYSFHSCLLYSTKQKIKVCKSSLIETRILSSTTNFLNVCQTFHLDIFLEFSINIDNSIINLEGGVRRDRDETSSLLDTILYQSKTMGHTLQQDHSSHRLSYVHKQGRDR